ncbi:MAG TPA: hypothetical protein VFY41_05115 [Nitrososphaeraceae archaeon]|nr:hypothetical protein [Nitrososphaeraceae archaeon]
MLFAPILLSNLANGNNNKGSVAYSAIHSLFTGFIFFELSIVGFKKLLFMSLYKKFS